MVTTFAIIKLHKICFHKTAYHVLPRRINSDVIKPSALFSYAINRLTIEVDTDRCSPSDGSQVVRVRDGWTRLEGGGPAAGRRDLGARRDRCGYGKSRLPKEAE